MQRTLSLLGCSLIATTLVIASMSAQTPSDPNVVLLRVSAEDESGRATAGLAKENFKVFEDSVPQDIVVFSPQDAPLSFAVLLDVDEPARAQVKTMAFERLMTVTRPQDQFFVADFPNSPLNEAVYQSIQSLQERGKEHRRALLLFTTKQDPGAYPFSKVASLLKDSDVQLYVVAFSPTANSEILRELAASSGGESFFPPSMISLPGIFSRIRTGVGNGYVIGYRSTNAATDGKWRKVKVTAELPDRRSTRNLSVRSKAGYYAPGIASR